MFARKVLIAALPLLASFAAAAQQPSVQAPAGEQPSRQAPAEVSEPASADGDAADGADAAPTTETPVAEPKAPARAPASAASTSAAETLAFADHLFLDGDWYRSITEYRRFLFEVKGRHEEAPRAALAIGEALLRGQGQRLQADQRRRHERLGQVAEPLRALGCRLVREPRRVRSLPCHDADLLERLARRARGCEWDVVDVP